MPTDFPDGGSLRKHRKDAPWSTRHPAIADLGRRHFVLSTAGRPAPLCELHMNCDKYTTVWILCRLAKMDHDADNQA
jgi:hypothetical protein